MHDEIMGCLKFSGPQGPPGTILKYDLLESYPGGRLGAFKTVDWNPGHVNNEVQYYKPENAVQDPSNGEITITAERRADGKIYSARYFFHKTDIIPRYLSTFLIVGTNKFVSD